MKLQKIIDVIETIASPEKACEWDNIGLMIGNVDNEITKIVVSLDFDENAVEYAIKSGAELIITHHPAIFKPIKNITDKLIIKTIQNNIAVYSAHTNLDAAVGGVNYALAECIEMFDCTQYGMMRVGFVKDDTFINIIDNIKKSLNVSALRVVGDFNKTVKKVAVLGGSGGDFISDACELNCDLFITGECKYNQAQLADKKGICLISAGHFETENPVVNKFVNLLKMRLNVDIEEVPSKNIYRII